MESLILSVPASPAWVCFFSTEHEQVSAQVSVHAERLDVIGLSIAQIGLSLSAQAETNENIALSVQSCFLSVASLQTSNIPEVPNRRYVSHCARGGKNYYRCNSRGSKEVRINE